MAAMRDEPLSKEEQEEEELRNELLNFGCFDKTMRVDEMRHLLQALKESKETSDYMQYTPNSPLLNDSKSSPSTLESSTQSSNRPLPSISYKNSLMRNNSTTQSSEKEVSKENSQESTLNQSFEQSSSSEINNPDNEIIHNIPNLEDSNYPALRTRSSVKSNTSELMNSRLRPRDNKKAIPLSKQKLLERWRLNPFDFEEEESVPLQDKEAEPSPYSYDIFYSEKFEELCQQMDAKLTSLQKLFSLDLPRNDLWGSPIKASTKWNGSLDKNPFDDKSPPQPSHSQDTSAGDTHERASKRKALCTIAAATHSNSNDENSEDEFIYTKKRKCQQGKKEEEVLKKNQESQKSKSTVSTVEMIDAEDSKNISNMEFNNSNLSNEFNSTKSIFGSESIKDEAEYPRRVIPPNPGKKSFKGPRANKKKNITQSPKSIVNKQYYLCDDEINKTLHEINAQIDDNDCVDITEGKPLSELRPMQKKLQMASSRLISAHDIEEQKIKDEEEARKQKEREEMFRRDELVSKRLQEQEDEHSRELQKEIQRKEREIIHNNILNKGKRITRSNFKTKQNYAEMDEDVLLGGDDDDPTITHTNLVSKDPVCPICRKTFPSNQIERHASECDAFSSGSDEVNNQRPSTSYSSLDILECHICNKFQTRNGYMYEDHIVSCKDRADDRRNGTYHNLGIH